jgi:integrase
MIQQASVSSRRCSVLKSLNAIIVYDLQAGGLDQDLHDYAYYLLNGLKSKTSTVHGHILNLIAFADFLDLKGIKRASVSSSCLEKFRDDAVRRVLLRETSKGDRKTAEGTVDEKLRNIYKWLLWMQTKGKIPPGTIGPLDCRVLCGVASISELTARRRRQMSSLIPLFPLLFRNRGAGASRYKSKAIISRAQQETLVEYFMDADQSEYVRRRNALIADVAAAVGFRRDSICSLRVAQFDPTQLLDGTQSLATDAIEIRPARQKRNYKNVFDFPRWLAVEVAVFILGPRRKLLQRLSIKEDINEGIFLSERTGNPLTPPSVTKIFSTAVRQIGCQPGTSIHALRRLFAIEAVEEEVEMRVKRGLATDTESICRAVALKMGHADWKSLVHYVSQVRRNIEGGVSRREEKRVLAALQIEVEKVRSENDSLKAVLAALEKSGSRE